MNTYRRQQAYNVRVTAAELAREREHPAHVANGDEQKFRDPDTGAPNYLASYTKGLPHDLATGLIVDPLAFQAFVKAIDSGDPQDFVRTPLGPADGLWHSAKARDPLGDGQPATVRAWESQGAGLTFDLEGPDAQAVTMPPAPTFGSDELTAEMAEVYAQALLRDVSFTRLQSCDGAIGCDPECKQSTSVQQVLDVLNELPWFTRDNCCDLSNAETSRLRGPFTGRSAFRGITPGDAIGPYVSQFLLAGNRGINPVDGARPSRSAADGLISYGAITVNQRVRFAQCGDDHMQEWAEWLDVQNGADLRHLEAYTQAKLTDGARYQRFITTPRDLATYVHYDALYEAYLNACLLLLGNGVPFDPDIPFQRPDFVPGGTGDHQQGFAHFGGPHILSLVTEVATRALKAVRYQKFNVHRRCRPEVLAARLHKASAQALQGPELVRMRAELAPMLDLVNQFNPTAGDGEGHNHLLPMAFCEGSPMHPAYGAGHATVAGACVTILKAFFDHKATLAVVDNEGPDKAYVPTEDGSALVPVHVVDSNGNGATLTVEGELNKLASNISIGRDWAGVHYFTDYIESVRMGEQLAIGILEEQKLTYGENFSMTVPLYDGGSVRI